MILPAHGSRLVLLLAALSPLAVRADQVPTYRITPDGQLVVASLPEVLLRPEVHEHLTSGLTTTLAMTVTVDRAPERRRGAARVDLRWEPWDEVFLATWIGADGAVRRQTLAALDELVTWWRWLELTVATGVSPDGRPRVTVELVVLPFSKAERDDAQRWLTDALGPWRAGGGGAGDSPSAEPGRASGVVDLLFATSIQRRSVARFAWAAVPAEPRAD